MYYVLQKYGNNENFFEIINEGCTQIGQDNYIVSDLRKKYEMLRTILIDDRAKQYGRASQYNFRMGDQCVNATGCFDYGRRRVQIPNGEIERMGNALLKNPGDEMPIDFYNENIEKVEYPMENVKEKVRTSKQPLNLIRQAFEKIKDIISKKKETNKVQEESER